MAFAEQFRSTGPSTVVVMQRLHVVFGLFPEHSGVVGVNCSCGVPLRIIWGEVDIMSYSVVLVTLPEWGYLDVSLDFFVLNIPCYMIVFLNVFGFLMLFGCFTVIWCCSVSVVRVFSHVHLLAWGVTFRC